MRLTILIMVASLFAGGCRTLSKKSQENISETPAQARANIAPNQATADVYMAAFAAGQNSKLVSSATQNVDKGYRHQDAGKLPARDVDGNIIWIELPGPNGMMMRTPLMVEYSSEFSLSSYIDLTGGVRGLGIDVGKIVFPPDGNRSFGVAPFRDGLSITAVEIGGGASSANADAITAFMQGQAANKTAAAQGLTSAIAAEWVGRGKQIEYLSNGLVRIGEMVGKQILAVRLGPAGKVLDVLVKKMDDSTETVTVKAVTDKPDPPPNP